MAPARKTKSSGPVPPARTLIIDNGGSTIKAGFSSPETPSSSFSPQTIPNCLARDRERKVYIGSQLDKCKDFGEIVFRRPVEKGYIVNWEAQKEIWENEFFDEKAQLYCDPKETGLILTEAPNALPALQTACDQMVFEEFGFARYLRCSGPMLNAYHDIPAVFKGTTREANATVEPAEIMMVVDSGYSHTTITPLLNGKPLQSAIRRLDVGGKFMTNYLTRLLSVREYDMRNDTYLVNEIKEATSYLSRDFRGDMEKTWKGPRGDRREIFATGGGIAKDYVLPDYHERSKGFVRDHDPAAAAKLKLAARKAGEPTEDFLTLRNERFAVPELLFNPSDVGIRQSGIAQLIMDSLSVLPVGLWPGMLTNIVCVGGNTNIIDFVHRLQTELRALAPAECIVRVARVDDPIAATWKGGAELARNEDVLRALSVTKQEYEEHGASWVARKFGTS